MRSSKRFFWIRGPRLPAVSYTHLGTFDNRQVLFRTELQLVADPLPLCAFFPHDLRVKISLYGKSAGLNQLDHHRQARNRTLILNVGKIQMCIRDSEGA